MATTRDSTTPASSTLVDEARRRMPTSLLVVTCLYFVGVVFEVFGLAVDGPTPIGCARVLLITTIAILLVRGSEGARVFVQFSAVLSAAVGALAVLASMAVADGGAIMGVGIAWITLGIFTYRTLASNEVQSWMASRRFARLGD